MVRINNRSFNMKYLIGHDGNAIATIGGETYSFGKSHPRYNKLVHYLENEQSEFFEAAYDIVSAVQDFSEGYIGVENGQLSWDGNAMPEMFTDTMLDMMDQGFPFEPMLNFLDNMSDNPSDSAIVELFDFMGHKQMPITADGCFLAYKAVDNNYRDLYTNTFDNSVGSVCEMPRADVDSNREKHCSAGLHVGAIDYAKQYGGIDDDSGDDEGGSGNRLMICKVNPADVISVPTDSRCQKLRACRYEVVSEFEDVYTSVVHMNTTDMDYINTQKRNKEWVEEVGAKIERVNSLLKRKKQYATA